MQEGSSLCLRAACRKLVMRKKQRRNEGKDEKCKNMEKDCHHSPIRIYAYRACDGKGRFNRALRFLQL